MGFCLFLTIIKEVYPVWVAVLSGGDRTVIAAFQVFIGVENRIVPMQYGLTNTGV